MLLGQWLGAVGRRGSDGTCVCMNEMNKAPSLDVIDVVGVVFFRSQAARSPRRCNVKGIEASLDVFALVHS